MTAADELLSRHQERARKEVTDLLPGYPQRLWVREMSPRQRAKWLDQNQKDSASSDARLIIACLVDEAGNPVFTQQHLPLLTGDDTGVAWITRLATLAARVSGLLWKEGDELKNGQGAGLSIEPRPDEA